ncbi:hypothetical protein EPA93_39145 [Ktedonosporobacter rubrisoli]|uniref:Peptidase S53 domain-containing protein n=1 Tax=Ktedonosporobacter rubrisoli TaxID=2509675 RepID=A0A4P6K0F2_KTERU|nr:S53 family peptidase [Ktedonosporobacter rubrisoli]QBD81668.1 hypothetical protein EPA93_39145 [Ktedonosporobacter rubrisoli]
MQKPPLLRCCMCIVVAMVAILSILSTPLFSPATAHAASFTTGYNSSLSFGVRPLWKYAKKISAGQIPPCVSATEIPRCYSPQQIRKAYNIQPLLDAGTTGKGRTIAIIDGSSSPTLMADVKLYDKLYGLNDPKINIIAPFGLPPFEANAYTETALDIQIAHTLAPDATINLVLADTSRAQTPTQFASILLTATKYAVDNDLGDVISQSFGVGETCVDQTYLQAEHQIFQAARDKQITVLASSGDTGAADIVCKGSTLTYGQTVNVPAADPLVTGVGGTTLNAKLGGKYISETAWNEGDKGGGSTGGGFSTIYSRPSYQDNIPGIHSGRGVPDIAYDGDPFTGVPVVISMNGGTLIIPVGGTSVGAPAWAGIVALADQYAGKRLGFLNETLYRISQSSSYGKGFHDITDGNNSVKIFDPSGKEVSVEGYNAHAGWDPVTGVGTPKVNSLVHLLASFDE